MPEPAPKTKGIPADKPAKAKAKAKAKARCNDKANSQKVNGTSMELASTRQQETVSMNLSQATKRVEEPSEPSKPSKLKEKVSEPEPERKDLTQSTQSTQPTSSPSRRSKAGNDQKDQEEVTENDLKLKATPQHSFRLHLVVPMVTGCTRVSIIQTEPSYSELRAPLAKVSYLLIL